MGPREKSHMGRREDGDQGRRKEGSRVWGNWEGRGLGGSQGLVPTVTLYILSDDQ